MYVRRRVARSTSLEEDEPLAASMPEPVVEVERQEVATEKVEAVTEEVEIAEEKVDKGKSKEVDFSCHICLGPVSAPVVSPCGHLYCWSCIYEWFCVQQAGHTTCPVCKTPCSATTVIPIYSVNGDEVDPRQTIPPRPRPPPVPIPPARPRFMNNNGLSFHAGVFPLPGMAMTWNWNMGNMGPGVGEDGLDGDPGVRVLGTPEEERRRDLLSSAAMFLLFVIFMTIFVS